MASVREEGAMSDFANEHMRRHHNEYTLRLPTPPRIVVPPPTHNAPPLRMVLHPDATGLDFLRSMELEDIVQTNVLLDWTYERRRLAQMVLPWLHVGPMVAVKDQDFLRREGITMVLAIRAQPKSMTGAMNAAQAVCDEVAAVDSPTFHEVITCFPETARLINEHVTKIQQQSLQTTGQPKLGKVLVFCESGNEKAAAVVAAYLMDMLNDFDHIKAMQVCQAQRFCINFDDTLKRVLQNYWEIVQARRSVRNNDGLSNGSYQSNGNSPRNGTTNNPTGFHVQKRTIDDLDDDDMDFVYVNSSDASDALRFADRDVTPFQSRE